MLLKLDQYVQNGASLSEIVAYLDGVDARQRVLEISKLGRGSLKKLFDLASANLNVSDLIPDDYPALKEVIFYGCNSLPVNRSFQKRMSRLKDASGLIGYNHQKLIWLSGPGYFVVNQNTERPGQVMIDYTDVPRVKPPLWPEIKSNDSGISALVYGGMKDFLKRVSRDVFIGEACKKGKSINQYFILSRSL